MSKLFQRVLLALTLTVSSIGILSSCITLQDMRKPRHNHSQKKKHPNATRIEYKIKTPNHSNRHKGHDNGHGKGHHNSEGKSGKKH